MSLRSISSLCCLLGFLLVSCQAVNSTAIPKEETTINPTVTPQPTLTPSKTVTPRITATIKPTQEEILAVTASPQVTVEQEIIMGERVEIEGIDGLKLVGTLYTPGDSPSPWPVVILLHMMWGDRGSWEDFSIQLTDADYAVFTVDMRGHGDTGGELDWELAGNDLQQIWNYLGAKPDIDEDRMAVLGASIGANLALVTGADNSNARTVVLLSPGLNYAGVETRDPLLTYGERPILIVASQEDTYAADSSGRLEEIALGETRLVMYQGAGHGLHMFDREPGLADLIIDWLDEYLT
jgi:dipeptidyl aminopeptidase/acylaminoacyl peptidase